MVNTLKSKSLELEVRKSNPAVKTYENLGFKEFEANTPPYYHPYEKTMSMKVPFETFKNNLLKMQQLA